MPPLRTIVLLGVFISKANGITVEWAPRKFGITRQYLSVLFSYSKPNQVQTDNGVEFNNRYTSRRRVEAGDGAYQAVAK